MQLDLGNEKALSNKAESARAQLEKQNRELKVRLSELEEVARKGNKNQVTTLEQKVIILYPSTTLSDRQCCVERQMSVRYFASYIKYFVLVCDRKR